MMDGSMFPVMVASFAVMTFIAGGMCVIVPWIMRKGECFAVSVPESARHHPRIAAMRRSYTGAMTLLTVLCTVAVAWVPLAMGEQGTEEHPVVFIAVLTGAVLVPVAASFALMLHYRKQVQELKAQEGWQAPAGRSAALVADIEMPHAVSLWWNLLYLPVIALTAAVALAGYPYMPDMVPMHADFAGNVNDWAPKSYGVALFPVAIQAFMAVVFVFSHWSITRSKMPVDPARPTASAYAYGVFARAQSIFLLFTGLLISMALGIAFVLSAIGIISMGVAVVIILAATAPVLVGAVAISVVYGQAGSRVFARISDSDAMPADDDEHWKLGIFYYNPDDASLFLPERFGVGWTVNLARPAVWAIIAGFAVLMAVFLAAIFAMVGA